MSIKTITFFNLPHVVVRSALTFLDASSLSVLCRTSKAARRAASDEALFYVLLGNKATNEGSYSAQWHAREYSQHNPGKSLYLIRTLKEIKFRRCCAYSPDGTEIVAGTAEGGALRVFNRATGQLVSTLPGDPVLWCGFSPDGKQILSRTRGGAFSVRDKITGDLVSMRTESADVGMCCTYSQDGEEMLSGAEGNALKVWNRITGAVVRTLEGHKGKVLCCAYSPDDKELLSGSSDETLRVWDRSTGACLSTLHVGSVVYACTYSPDGKKILTGSADRALKIWDRRAKAFLVEMRSRFFPEYCAYSPDGKEILVGGANNTLEKWDFSLSVEQILVRKAEKMSKDDLEQMPEFMSQPITKYLKRLLPPDQARYFETFSSQEQRRDAVYSHLRATALRTLQIDFALGIPSAMERFNALPMALRGPVYYQMYLLKRPDGPTTDNFGETTFHTNSTSQEKADAIIIS